ncbi:MAG: short-chain dehydrogenase [Alteromonas sp. Nap_26]|nr:MAG: short-chain dehydrogenase [Alteromonas sp. Nap_26]
MTIALITGGSRGLGKASALALASEGLDVVITYKDNIAAANDVIDEVHSIGQKAVAIKLDTADVNSFDNFVLSISQILEAQFNCTQFDYLLNNAGVGINLPFTDTTEEILTTLFDMHVKGPYLLTQKLLPLLRDGSAILNVSSGLTRFCFPGYSAYAMAKGAVEVMSRYMANELSNRKIRVNTLAPGAIETDFGNGYVRDTSEVNSAIAARTALGRVGLPDDIGAVVALLLNDKSYWINGQRIEASGGMNI